MLAQAVISPYQYAEDFRSPADYLTYMFGDKDGFFSRNLIRNGIMQREYFLRKEKLAQMRWAGYKDLYISQNSFLTTHKKDTPNSGRKVNNIKRFNALYVDIDCYAQGLDKDEVLYTLHESYFDRKIPYPTFVIDSGRGLYLIYKIDEDRNALPRWQAVEDYLVKQLLPLGADAKAADAARILRVPGSINSKNGQPVRILRFANIQYTLHDIIREYNIAPVKTALASKTRLGKGGKAVHPYGQATDYQRKTARWIATELNIPLPDFESYEKTFEFIKHYLPLLPCNRPGEAAQEPRKPINLPKRTTIKSMLAGRMEDLLRLFSIRKGEDCCREAALFLYRNWHLDLYNDPEKALEATLSFNAMLDRPLAENYVTRATASAEKKHKAGSTYTYSTKKIIELLKIQPEEAREMRYLCGCAEDLRERKKQANRRGYLLRLERAGKEQKNNEIKNRREQIAAMLAVGKSKAEICAALNLASRTFDRDKAAVLAEGLIEKVKEEIKRIAEAAALAAEVRSARSKAFRGLSPFFQRTYSHNCMSIANTAISTPYREEDYTDTGQPRAP